MANFLGSDILKLAELLKQSDQDDFDDEQKVKTSTKKSNSVETQKPKIVRQEEKVNNDDDEDPETKLEKHISSETDLTDSDWRKVPQWNLIYKQAVSPSDVYLQMSAKTQLTSSCEEMVIVVELPGEKAPNIDVQVRKNHLDLLSPQFRLSIPLPHPVNPQKGSAKWDAFKDALILTLVMEREFDYVNF